MNWLTKEKWSPYIAGTLTGLLMISSVWVAGKYFGASTTFVRSAGMIEKVFSAERIGKITLPQVLGINHWIIIVLFIIGGLALFWWFEKKRL